MLSIAWLGCSWSSEVDAADAADTAKESALGSTLASRLELGVCSCSDLICAKFDGRNQSEVSGVLNGSFKALVLLLALASFAVVAFEFVFTVARRALSNEVGLATFVSEARELILSQALPS